MVITRRHLRFAGIAALVWLIVEVALFALLSQSIGFFPAFVLMSAKGVLGLILFSRSLRAVLAKVALRDLKNGLAAVSDAGFAAAGAFLIFLPGVVTTLAGLALFSHSVRTAIVRRLQRERQRDPDGIVSLDADEWREIDTPGGSPRRGRVAKDTPRRP